MTRNICRSFVRVIAVLTFGSSIMTSVAAQAGDLEGGTTVVRASNDAETLGGVDSGLLAGILGDISSAYFHESAHRNAACGQGASCRVRGLANRAGTKTAEIAKPAKFSK